MTLRCNISYLIITFILLLIEVWIVIVFKTGFIRHTVGDYIAVILLYALIRAITNLGITRPVIITLGIAYGLECLQLTSFLRLINLDHNYWAKLVFGNTFHLTDLIAYTLGALTVLIVEYSTKEPL